MFQEVRKRRTSSQSSIEKRAALAFVRPLVKCIPAWQIQAARLIGCGEYSRPSGRDSLLREARALEDVVRKERQSLDQALALASDVLANSGHVRDVLRAMDSIAIASSRAVFLLSRSTPRPRFRSEPRLDQVRFHNRPGRSGPSRYVMLLRCVEVVITAWRSSPCWWLRSGRAEIVPLRR
jgi:hypothetical protein